MCLASQVSEVKRTMDARRIEDRRLFPNTAMTLRVANLQLRNEDDTVSA